MQEQDMQTLAQSINDIRSALPGHVALVAVTKTKPVELLKQAYDLGLRDFGENRVQEMVAKQQALPADIRWHQIGHLQTNKVKLIAPFVHLIHSVDSLRLLQEINQQGNKNNRIIDCLLQIYIATEETKFGLSLSELTQLLESPLLPEMHNIRIRGLMGMASFIENHQIISREFAGLFSVFQQVGKKYFVETNYFDTLSMGMSGDFMIAVEEGSNMVRIGSALFGAR